MKNKKGILLIYVLFISVLISIFLLTAVGNMNNSFLLTNKFNGEAKAYWAAETGFQYCEYKLKDNLGWPFLTNKGNTTENFGKFTIKTSKEDNGNGYYVHGKSNDEEEFCIYFSKNKHNESSAISIVPDTLPSEPKGLSYCSYTSIKESDITNLSNGTTNNTDVSSEEIIVSKSPTKYKALINPLGIYIVSDGRYGAYRSVVEKMLIADNSSGLNAGIYAGGDINILLSGDSSTFQVSNMANSKPEIYCKGALKITREKKANSELKYSFPISIENGQIYYGTLFKIIDKVDNGTKVSNSKKTNNELKRTYGLNLEKYSSSKDDLFPKIQWNDVENIKTTQDKKKMTEEIDSGSYVAIFEEESNKYILCRLNKNYMEKDGKISNKFQKDLEDVQDEINAEKDAFIKKHGIKKIDKNGNEYYELVKGSKEEAIYNKKCKDKYLIKKLIKKVNGLSSEEEINEANNIWDSKNKHYSNIFSIETIPINYKINYDEDDEDKEDEHSTKIKAKFCPKITLKKSVIAKPTKNQDNLDEEYFNLFTVTKNNTSEKFDIDQAVTTELFFQEQINEIPTTEGEKVIIDKNMTMLYTNGYVSINGKLSGNGQILSGGSIYFKVGTQLNTGLKIEESNNKFALYSKGTIQMGVPKGKGNLTELYEKIRIVLANQSALYTNTIVNRALNQEIELTKKEKARMSETTGNKMSLKECMTKCYGYTSKEAKNFLENIVQKNSYITYNYNNYYYNYRYNMPEKAEDIKIESQYPSTFNGVIYSWGGFKSDAEYNDVLINGVLVTFGADPNYQPGSGEGLNEEELLHLNNGDIKIDNCENFKVIYTSSDINAFMKLCKQEKPIYLTKIYQNILYH